MFKLGLIINPFAGAGGPLGEKGSDALAARASLENAVQLRSTQRCARCLDSLSDLKNHLAVYGYRGSMAGDVVLSSGFNFNAIGEPSEAVSTAEDTIQAARQLADQGVDLLLFVGGDGTARDIYRALADRIPVLGLPAGVKMHSGVYAVSPEAAAEIIRSLIEGRLVDIGPEEVRDIDEEAFRRGRVRARHYGELLVPRCGRFLQHVKNSGREVEELAVADIAADVVEAMDDQALYFIGPGTTTRAVMEELGLPNTLLGVDAIRGGQLLGSDLNAEELTALLNEHREEAYIVLTAIGGQGHIFGRGNQQFCPALIRRIGLDHILVLATKSKITELEGRPLLVDTNDPELDRELEGFIRIITGYHDAIMYRVSASGH